MDSSKRLPLIFFIILMFLCLCVLGYKKMVSNPIDATKPKESFNQAPNTQPDMTESSSDEYTDTSGYVVEEKPIEEDAVVDISEQELPEAPETSRTEVILDTPTSSSQKQNTSNAVNASNKNTTFSNSREVPLITTSKFSFLDAYGIAINTDQYRVPSGTAVRFKNVSQNAKLHSWDFGDGSSSYTWSPTHTYNTAGTYTVTLTVDDVSSRKTVVVEAPYTPPVVQYTKPIIVNNIPEPTVLPSPQPPSNTIPSASNSRTVGPSNKKVASNKKQVELKIKTAVDNIRKTKKMDDFYKFNDKLLNDYIPIEVVGPSGTSNKILYDYCKVMTVNQSNIKGFLSVEITGENAGKITSLKITEY